MHWYPTPLPASGDKMHLGVIKVQYSGDDRMNRQLSCILNWKHKHVHRETWMRLKYHSNYTDKSTFLKWKIMSVRKQMEKAKTDGDKCRTFKACFDYKVKSLLPLKSSSASQDSKICSWSAVTWLWARNAWGMSFQWGIPGIFVRGTMAEVGKVKKCS